MMSLYNELVAMSREDLRAKHDKLHPAPWVQTEWSIRDLADLDFVPETEAEIKAS